MIVDSADLSDIYIHDDGLEVSKTFVEDMFEPIHRNVRKSANSKKLEERKNTINLNRRRAFKESRIRGGGDGYS